ncbi:flagellar hook-length control protein FliK [bacterium]|nr:flagellar hook-length control protein FliK [bacterium]
MPVESITPGLHAKAIHPTQSYQPGQIVRGQLVERLPGDLWKIKLGNAETTARLTGKPLTGTTFNARITSTTPQMTLQILSSQSGKNPLGQAGLPSSEGLTQLAQMVKTLNAGAASQLQPILSMTDTTALTPQITQWIEGFGHLFEGRLAVILADLLHVNPLLTHARLKRHRGLLRLFKTDLKPILIRLKNNLAGQTDALSKQLAGRIERWLDAYGPDESGLLSIPLPWDNGEARLELRLPRRNQSRQSFQMAIEMDSTKLGPMRISFWHTAEQLIIRLNAQNQSTIKQFEKEKESLQESLQGSFQNVEVRVGEWGEHIVFKRPKLDMKG